MPGLDDNHVQDIFRLDGIIFFTIVLFFPGVADKWISIVQRCTQRNVEWSTPFRTYSFHISFRNWSLRCRMNYSNILLTSMRWYYFVEEDRKIVMTFGRYDKYRWTSGASQGAMELRHSQFSWDTNEGTWIPWVIFRALMRQGADSNYMSSLIDIVKISFNR